MSLIETCFYSRLYGKFLFSIGFVWDDCNFVMRHMMNRVYQHHSSSNKYSSFGQLIMILAQINPTTMYTQKQLHYTCRKAETNFPLYTHKVNAALSSWYSRAKCKRVVVSQEPEPNFFTIAKVGMAKLRHIQARVISFYMAKILPFELPLTITKANR